MDSLILEKEIKEIREKVDRKENEIITLHNEIHDLRIKMREFEIELHKLEETNLKGYDC
jgi:hypothetical protein